MKALYRLYKELQRRNVIKAGISYLVVSWVLLQVVSLISGILNAPQWLGKTLLISLILLLPVWLLFSWYFELTPEGIKRTVDVPREDSIAKKTSGKLNHFIIIFLSIAVLLLVVDRFFISERIKSELSQEYSPPVTTHSIAVLPFSDYSPESDQAYFADGLSEELLNLLSKIPKLKVISRTSSFSFKNSELPITSIAEELKVSYILEGSVRKNGDQLRITAQLIDATTDKHIWSKNFDKELENIFAIQDQVAQAVTKALELQLMGTRPLSQKTDPEVYSLYLQANQTFQRKNTAELVASEVLLRRAILLDSTYTPAKILLTKILQLEANFGVTDFKEGNKLAIEVIESVLEKHPENAVAHAVRADIALSYEWDFNKAEAFMERALTLDPSHPEVIHYAATLELSLGHFQKAVALNEYAVSLDPLNSEKYYGLGIAYYCNDSLKKAEEALRKSIHLNPDSWAVYHILSKVLLLQNKPQEALKALEKETDKGWHNMGLAVIYHYMGQTKQANEALKSLIQYNAEDMAYQIAQVYAFRKEPTKAFQWLEKAYEVHDLGLNEILSEPDFKSLHQDPRWNSFIKKLGFYR